MKISEVLTDDWMGCYREGWGSRLRPASYAHPAKNSYGLSVRIYEHALEEGWVKPGDKVVDCFSGIGGFALEAMRNGLHFVGCELEQRFVDMGQGCDCTGISKEDWARYQGRWDRMRYEGGRHWCPECLMKAGAVEDTREFKPLPLPGTKWAALAKTYQPMLLTRSSSASYVRNSGAIPWTGAHRYHGNIETWERDGMAGTAAIVQGDSRRLGEVLARASLCLSSPPYTASLNDGLRASDRVKYAEFARAGRGVGTNYGQTEGNLGNLPDTGFEAALAISSPVYIGSTASDDPDKRGGLYRDPKRRNDKTLTATYSEDAAQLAQMPEGDLALALGSPPFVGSIHEGGHGIDAEKLAGNKAGPNSQALIMDGYGREPGQLAALPEGDHAEACERPVCAISSPPYIGTPVSAQGADGKSQEWNNAYREYQRTGDHAKFQAQMAKKCDRAGYGSEQGQLGQMPTGSHAEALEAGAVTPACAATADRERAQACISSPPWETSVTGGEGVADRADWFRDRITPGGKVGQSVNTSYGDTPGQLGQETGSTFWAASRTILEQVYQVLAPGGHAIWVVKMFVRKKQLVDFPGQWEALCQSVGFRTVCKHRAWLNKNAGVVQVDFDGEEVSMEKWFKSFFRRLAESKGSPRIDWELVLCMVKE